MKTAKLTITLLAAAGFLGAQENNHLPPAAAATLSATMHDQPFLKNMGQWQPEILYQSSFGGGTARFLANGVSFCASRSANTEDIAGLNLHPEKLRCEGLVWNMYFANSSPGAEIRTINASESVYNFLYGTTADQQFIHVPQCEAIVYENIYRQTDIRYYRSENGLKYDVILHPGFDLAQAEFAFEGIEQLRIAENGNLEIGHAWGSYEELKPYSYQLIGGEKKEVAVEYALTGDQSFGFRITGKYDPGYDLVIDPFIYVWGTYMGSTGVSPLSSASNSIAMDIASDIYITGMSNGSYPVPPGSYQGSYDVIVTKLNAAGTAVIYTAVIGGSGDDIGLGIDVDLAKCPYITGLTRSVNFPANGFQVCPCTTEAAFVARLNVSGTAFVYSTVLDGSGMDAGYAISVNKSTGKSYVTGYTSSANFPVTPGAFQGTIGSASFLDAFVTELDNTGMFLVFSTYLGGSMADQGFGIMLGSTGDVFVTGVTGSLDFPVLSAYQPAYGGGTRDAFVTRLNLGGTGLVYSTYLGGNTDDIGMDIDVNSSQEAFVAGYTDGNFPVVNAVQPVFGGTMDAFAGKLKPSGQQLWYMTYLGGSLYDQAHGIAINPAGEAFISGVTYSANFPVTPNTLDPALGGPSDFFVTHLVRDGGGYGCGGSTYIGGSADEIGFAKIVVDPNAGNHVAVNGSTLSSNFPTTPGVYCPAQLNPGNTDVVVFKLRAKCTTRYGSFDTITPGNTLTVFPNPAGDRTSVNFTLTADAQTTVVVYNLQGQPVQTLFNGIAEKDRPYSLELLMNELPAGGYIVEVRSEQWSGHSTIIRVE